MTYVDRVRVVVCDHQNRTRSMFLEFLLIVESLLTFSDKVRALIFADQNRVRSMFLEFCKW